MRGYSMHKDDYRTRLRRIEGQVRGLERMVDEDEYCVDILTQIVSVTKALQGVGLGLLDEHLRSCVRGAAESSRAEGDAKLTEAVQAVERLLKVWPVRGRRARRAPRLAAGTSRVCPRRPTTLRAGRRPPGTRWCPAWRRPGRRARRRGTGGR